MTAEIAISKETGERRKTDGNNYADVKGIFYSASVFKNCSAKKRKDSEVDC